MHREDAKNAKGKKGREKGRKEADGRRALVWTGIRYSFSFDDAPVVASCSGSCGGIRYSFSGDDVPGGGAVSGEDAGRVFVIRFRSMMHLPPHQIELDQDGGVTGDRMIQVLLPRSYGPNRSPSPPPYAGPVERGG